MEEHLAKLVRQDVATGEALRTQLETHGLQEWRTLHDLDQVGQAKRFDRGHHGCSAHSACLPQRNFQGQKQKKAHSACDPWPGLAEHCRGNRPRSRTGSPSFSKPTTKFQEG
eukprot:s1460_g6.t1